MSRIVIPYTPRYPEVHEALERHRFTVLVAHRRFGKTVLAVNHLLKEALLCRRARGSFAYVAPFRNQAKAVAWDYLKHYSGPVPNCTVNESELSVTLPNSAKMRIFGADTPDALRGLYFDGVILDEVAQMKPEVWGEIIQPALADRGGWALFIGTPKGINLFSELYNRGVAAQAAGDETWCAMSYPVTKTHALPAEEVERLEQELSPNAWRQEMMCDFSASSDDVLIPLPLVQDAMQRDYKPHDYAAAPLVFGVDVARFGSDSSVIFPRRGLVALKPIIMHGIDNMELADRIAAEMHRQHPDAVFIDQGGGTGVIDRLRQLGQDVVEVPFGGKAAHSERYINRRAEMWDGVKEWLNSGGALPPDEALKAELSMPTYSFDPAGRIKLERKEDLKERLTRSPDRADALALTFAAPVAVQMRHAVAQTEYDIWSV